MEGNDVDIKQFPKYINKFTLELLFSFCIKSLGYFENITDPISKCLTNFKQIQFILDFEDTNASIYFFFLAEKSFTI